MRKEIYFASILTTSLIVLYYLYQKGKFGTPISVPEKPPEVRLPEIPEIELIPIYPEPNKAYFHALTRQEIEVGVVNKSAYSLELHLSGEFRVPDINYKQYLWEQVIRLKPKERTSVKWRVDFPFIAPWDVKRAIVFIDVKDYRGYKLSDISWQFYIKGRPLF